MNYSKYRFTLDMQSNISQVSLPVRQYDTGIRLYISLTDGGNPYIIEDGCRAVFCAKKADGNPLMNDCVIEKNTTVCYELTQQTTTCSGVVDCELRLYGSKGNLITSPRFILVIDERVVHDEDFPLSESDQDIIDNIILSEQGRIEAEQERERASAEALANAKKATELADELTERLKVEDLGDEELRLHNENPEAHKAILGKNNIKGLKGYWIKAVAPSENRLELSQVTDRKSVGKPDIVSELTTDETANKTGYAVGDIFSIITAKNHYNLCGKITAIEGKQITYTPYTNIDWDAETKSEAGFRLGMDGEALKREAWTITANIAPTTGVAQISHNPAGDHATAQVGCISESFELTVGNEDAKTNAWGFNSLRVTQGNPVLLSVGETAYLAWTSGTYNEYIVKTNKNANNIIIYFTPKTNNWTSFGNNLLSVNGVSVVSTGGNGTYNLGSTNVAYNSYTARPITITIDPSNGEATIVDSIGNEATVNVGSVFEEFKLKINQDQNNGWVLDYLSVRQQVTTLLDLGAKTYPGFDASAVDAYIVETNKTAGEIKILFDVDAAEWLTDNQAILRVNGVNLITTAGASADPENDEDYSFCVSAKPSIGIVKISEGGLPTGKDNAASGKHSVTSGEGNSAHGAFADAGGLRTSAGYCAFTRGVDNKAEAKCSSAIAGSKNKTENDADYSTVGGFDNTASGVAQFVYGKGLRTSPVKDAQSVVGEYNVPNDNALFQVGNGDDTERSNAFEIISEGTKVSMALGSASITEDVLSSLASKGAVVIQGEYVGTGKGLITDRYSDVELSFGNYYPLMLFITGAGIGIIVGYTGYLVQKSGFGYVNQPDPHAAIDLSRSGNTITIKNNEYLNSKNKKYTYYGICAVNKEEL